MAHQILINKQELLDNHYYLGESNHATVGKWNANLQVFEYVSNSEVLTVPHFSDIDLKSDLDAFYPIQELTVNKQVLTTGKLQVV